MKAIEIPSRKNLYLMGMSFRTASIEHREAACLHLEDVGTAPADLEVVLLNTCNRNEIYLATSDDTMVKAWTGALRTRRSENPFGHDSPFVYRRRGPDAIRHLFRVASGLDSAILGDGQILGQVRQAMSASAERGLLGSFLQKTFALALGAGARARRETAIGQGAASVGSALAGMLAARFGPREGKLGPEIAILGAGEIARDAARHLRKRGFDRLLFLNRTASRARELARELGGRVEVWPSLDETLRRADVIVAAVKCSTPVLTRERLDAAIRTRPRALLVIDLGMPRNVEPGSGYELIDIDHVREQRDSALARRRAAVERVETIVEEALVSWRRLYGLQLAEARIKSLYRAANRVSREAGSELAALGSVDSREAERVVLRSIKRLLHAHVRDLRELGAPWSDGKVVGEE